MAKNLTIPDKTTGSQHFAAEYQAVKDFINKPAAEGTTFDDTVTITVDHTEEFSTVRTVTGSTHTLTFATTGNIAGNYYKRRYTFDVDCTLTLTNLDTTGSTLGTVNPIPAGTYDLWFFVSYGNIALVIQNNTGTTPGTLTTPTFVMTAINGGFNYTISGIDLNATAGVLEYSDDNTNWSTDGGYVFGVNTGSVTGLSNGVLYYGRFRVSASGYNPSSYATDTATPSAGVIQLTTPTGLLMYNRYDTLVFLEFDAIDANADSVNVLRSTTSGSGFSIIDNISASALNYSDSTVVTGTNYYYKIKALGSGSYSSSAESSEVYAGWSPQEISADLVLWMSGLKGNVTTGSGLSTWYDISGNLRHFTQTTDANRPPKSVDGKKIVFSGSQWLDRVGSLSESWVKDFHDGTLSTYEICVKAKVVATGNTAIMGTSEASPTKNGFTVYNVNTDKKLGHVVGLQLPTTKVVNNISGNDAYVDGTLEWFRFTGKVADGTAGNRSTIYNESTSYANNVETGTPSTGNALRDMQIGAAGNNVIPFTGEIEEIIIVNRALTSQEWIDIKAR